MEEEKGNIKMLTVEEVQKILKIGRNKIYEIFSRADFPGILLGRKYVVEERAFYNWLQTRRT